MGDETVRAWQAAEFGPPTEVLRLVEVPRPVPGPGELLVRLDACGICHTDLHTWRGDHALPRE